MIASIIPDISDWITIPVGIVLVVAGLALREIIFRGTRR
jgi:hypothetical protein